MKQISFVLLATLITLVSISSCKQDNAASGSLFSGYDQLAGLADTYKSNPNPKSANELIKVLLEKLQSPDLDKSKRMDFLNYGLNISKEQNITARAASFLFPIIKESAGSGGDAQLMELAGMMKKLKKTTASNTLYQSIVDNYPNSESAKTASAAITEPFESVDKYVFSLGEKIFIDPDNTGINRNAAMNYVDACEAYALGYPSSDKAPDYLYKSADVAKSLRTYTKALSLHDWIIEKYPNYEKASTSLFLKGFIIENHIGDDNRAREIYNLFLKKYPNDDLADDVQFLIENLGLTDEQILEMIESKGKKK